MTTENSSDYQRQILLALAKTPMKGMELRRTLLPYGQREGRHFDRVRALNADRDRLIAEKRIKKWGDGALHLQPDCLRVLDLENLARTSAQLRDAASSLRAATATAFGHVEDAVRLLDEETCRLPRECLPPTDERWAAKLVAVTMAALMVMDEWPAASVVAEARHEIREAHAVVDDALAATDSNDALLVLGRMPRPKFADRHRLESWLHKLQAGGGTPSDRATLTLVAPLRLAEKAEHFTNLRRKAPR